MYLIEQQVDHLQNSGFNMDSIVAVFDVRDLVKPFVDLDEYADMLVVTAPTFDDICKEDENQFKVKYTTFDDTELAIVDIRTYCKALKMQSLLYLSTLFTTKVYIEDKYIDTFRNYFSTNRENIVKYDRQRVINKVYDKIQENKDNLDLANNLLYFLQHYCGCSDFRDCINPPQTNIPIEMVCDEAEVIKRTYDDIDSPRGQRGRKAINEGLKAILKISVNEEPAIESEDIYKKLTDKEQKALEEINKRTKGDGIVIISRLVEETGISRPVYNILLQKLRENGGAEIVNMGVKGTKIKMLI